MTDFNRSEATRAAAELRARGYIDATARPSLYGGHHVIEVAVEGVPCVVGAAIRYQHGPYRAGVQEWRTDDRGKALRKARRIATGEDRDNTVKPGGWLTLDQNIEGEWRAVEVVRRRVTDS